MNHAERDHIILCKRLIEEKFGFERENGTLRQRNLEYLADIIEEKSGIKLSLSTLKRLWKKDYDQTPHTSTLEGLVSVLGYKSWQAFKLQATVAPSSVQAKKRTLAFNIWMILSVAIALIVVLWLTAFHSPKAGKIKFAINGPVTFTGNKTILQGVPNTVIVNYDVSNVKADSFFFQQSWNEQEKVWLNPKEHYYSNIYYEPGFHTAKLIANDSIIKRFPVYITTDGWLPMVRYLMTNNTPVYLKNNRAETNGALHVSRNDLTASKVNVDKDFALFYYNVREFENTNSDNFSIDTRIICDSTTVIACPSIQLGIACEENIFFITIARKGCERNVGIKIGEVYRDGTNNDLSVFGRDVYKWQHLKLQVINKQATIYLDEEPVYTMSFKNDFGKVTGLVYGFTGIGAVDYVKLTNGENKLVYEDEFD